MAADNLKWVGTALDNGRFEVKSKLGEGGMGFVYKAFDNALQDDVVIKVPRRSMLDDPEFKERFDRENRALVKLQHPHVVSIIFVGEHGDLPYVVMRFLAGGDLKERQEKYDGVLPMEDFKTWLPQVASALDFVHVEGYIHRDVKPANILFDARGNVFLSDFGVAKVVAENKKSGESLTGAGMLLGTPEYMAPEMIQCETYSGQVDQYALAVTVYELLCGRVPFDGPTPQYILVQQSVGAIEPPMVRNPSVPEVVSNVVMAGLARDPAARYPSCVAFAESVIQAIAYTGTQVLPVPAIGGDSGSAQFTPAGGFGASGGPGSGTVPGMPAGSGTLPAPPPLPETTIDAAAEDTISNRGGQAGTAPISVTTQPAPARVRPQRTPEQRRKQRLQWALFAGMLTLPLLVTLAAVQMGGVDVLASRVANSFGRLTGLHWLFTLLTTTVVTGYVGWRKSLTEKQQRRLGTARTGLSVPALVGLTGVTTLAGSMLVFGSTGRTAAANVQLTDAEREATVPAVQWHQEGDIVNSLGMTLRCLKPGRLVAGEGPECLQQQPLWVSQSEVTVAQYLAFCDATGNAYLPDWLRMKLPGGEEDNPEFIRQKSSTWFDDAGSWGCNSAPITGLRYSSMVAFCNWLSRQPGEPLEYRLPTAQEWECAYRAGSESKFYWGDDFSGGKRVVSRVAGATAPIPFDEGNLEHNEWKLHHMAGNVWEVLDQGEQAAGGAWNESRQEAFAAQGRTAFPGPHPAFGFRVVGVPR